jgi:lysophospholipase L1-like esterase
MRTIPLLITALALSISAAAQQPHWVGTWTASPIAEPNPHHTFAQDTTLRQTVHVSLGGSRLRITVTNELGIEPLTLAGATVALSPASTDAPQPLTFSAQPTIVIPPGAVAVSDPISLNISPLSNLTISLFLPAQTLTTLTLHNFADATNYDAPGNQLTAPILATPHPNTYFQFIKDVEVDTAVNAPGAAAIVTLGDSITDGAASTRDANARWPDVLAQRLHANPATQTLAVLNAGIGGNRILHNDFGPSALARFDRDVLAQAAVKYLILLEGINDIGHAYDPRNPRDVVSAADLITGFTQLARRAHTHGIKVYGATITPYLGAGYASPAGESVRQAVNQWIRTTPELDGVIDFDKATRDPANPSTLAAANDSGDHLHPSDTGYKSMANAIDLTLFTK